MKRQSSYLIAATIAVGVLAVACSKKEPEKEYMVLGEYESVQDTLPRVRYFDGNQVSLNDRCAVRKTKLNAKMPPVYVNGQPIGFC
jgi:hypothetical protein